MYHSSWGRDFPWGNAVRNQWWKKGGDGGVVGQSTVFAILIIQAPHLTPPSPCLLTENPPLPPHLEPRAGVGERSEEPAVEDGREERQHARREHHCLGLAGGCPLVVGALDGLEGLGAVKQAAGGVQILWGGKGGGREKQREWQ